MLSDFSYCALLLYARTVALISFVLLLLFFLFQAFGIRRKSVHSVILTFLFTQQLKSIAFIRKPVQSYFAELIRRGKINYFFAKKRLSAKGRGGRVCPILKYFFTTKTLGPKTLFMAIFDPFLNLFGPSWAFFIGPESDHWQCLSVTDPLTGWLTIV